MAWRIIQNASVVKNNDTVSVGVLTAPGGEVREIAFIDSLIDVKNKIDTNTADITQLKTDTLDNTEAITQNTADIDELKVKTLPSVNLTLSSTLTTIPDIAFCANQSIISVTIPDGVTSIGTGAFQNCTSLASATISNSVTSIGNSAFKNCTSLASITIPNSVTSIGASAFAVCRSLANVTIPNSVTSIGAGAFSSCTKLTSVTLGNGFNANGLDLSASTKYTADTIVSWLNAFADRTGQTAYTLKIGATNKAKLTTEQLAIATNKNWSIA